MTLMNTLIQKNNRYIYNNNKPRSAYTNFFKQNKGNGIFSNVLNAFIHILNSFINNLKYIFFKLFAFFCFVFKRYKICKKI